MTSSGDRPFERVATGIKLHCRLTPRSALDKVAGFLDTGNGTALTCTVRAVPEKGKANGALAKLIAAWLDVPKSSVAVVAGNKSRYKTLEIDGDPDELAQTATARITELEQSE